MGLCKDAKAFLARKTDRIYDQTAMTSEAFITLIILASAIVLLLSNLLRADLVALLVMLSLGVTGVLAPSDLFAGFSRSAVITIIAIFILTNGLHRTGVTRWLGIQLLRLSGKGSTRATFVVMLAAAILSWFMNTIAAGAVLLPAVMGLSRDTGIKPSKLLMPLSFGTLLGGMATLLTTATILVNSGLHDAGLTQFNLFDFLPIGGCMALAGILFMSIFGRRLLPDRSPGDRYPWAQHMQSALSDLYNLQERLYEAKLEASSPLCGKTLAESRIGEMYGLSVLAVAHDGRTRLAPEADTRLYANDVLHIVGQHVRVQQLSELGFSIDLDANPVDIFSSKVVGLVEVLIAPRSRVVGQTLKQIHFRQKFGLTVVALWRGGRPYRTDVGDMSLQFGDALLMHGARNQVQLLQGESDFIVLLPEVTEEPSSRRGPLAAAIMLAALVSAAVGWLPIAEATFAGAVLMILTGCLSMDQAYQAIEWRAIFLIAGMLPLGAALSQTGAASFLGQGLIQTLGGFGSIVLMAGIYLLAVLLTQFLSGQATAVIITPIAISAAAQLNVEPHAFAMAAALACSAAFLTPIGHPINLLIMGPAGYTPRDFLKVGGWLTLICFIVLLILLPILRPF
jgi:di/tricarboxylate transporter